MLTWSRLVQLQSIRRDPALICGLSACTAQAPQRHKPCGLRREWEGATLRNSGTRANNLLPLRGGSVPEAAYAAAVATFWEHLPISAAFRTRSPGMALPA